MTGQHNTDTVTRHTRTTGDATWATRTTATSSTSKERHEKPRSAMTPKPLLLGDDKQQISSSAARTATTGLPQRGLYASSQAKTEKGWGGIARQPQAKKKPRSRSSAGRGLMSIPIPHKEVINMRQHVTPCATPDTITHAITNDLRDAGIQALTFRYTTLIEGLQVDGTRFVFSLTEGDNVTSTRATRKDLIAMFTPGGVA